MTSKKLPKAQDIPQNSEPTQTERTPSYTARKKEKET